MTLVFGKLGLTTCLLAVLAGCSTPTDSTSGEVAPEDLATASGENMPVRIDGSSTVYPITVEMAERFKQMKSADSLEIAINFSGTGGGFDEFCQGATDISNASRPITQEEMAECRTNGVQYVELPVAFDALTVVVNGENAWAQDITVEELKSLWESSAENSVTRWSQIRPDWPDEEILLYGPGEDSGTFDYFNEVIIGEDDASRTDYVSSEDDDELVQAVQSEPNALGYFGYAYYKEAGDSLKALAIDSGDGPMYPSGEAIRSNEYQPLARPLFIYISADSLDNNPMVAEFVEFYMANTRTVVTDIGYEPLPNEAFGIAMDHLVNRKVGSVFDGKAQHDLSIEALLEKEAAF
ncbi:phosphate binding protein [Leptolyngbya sp. Heron Island J]|uniref:PstS family phosphate ABC transporter substrate-binding protein n=1 Tax=Leptolyngbya sp. Heron Island J TaxID=1385935 RepID=UPI0003B96CF1|nr:PstS family phosphate ABC transporter substrate-binding protein [Leptolyngbya sp. Heron Island J]ESA34905.1 phosphate binding protein [Leptolyngbya sp. Heron Island J]